MLPSRLFFDDSFFKGDESIKSDIYEKDGNIILEMEAPGYTKDDINISIDNGTLSISFEKEECCHRTCKSNHKDVWTVVENNTCWACGIFSICYCGLTAISGNC